MSALFNHEMRQEIRKHIEASCTKFGFQLAENVIENLVTERIQALAREVVSGKNTGFVNWDEIVLSAQKKFSKQ